MDILFVGNWVGVWIWPIGYLYLFLFTREWSLLWAEVGIWERIIILEQFFGGEEGRGTENLGDRFNVYVNSKS